MHYDASDFEKQMIIHASEKNIPVSGSIELLPLCNMNCNMCYVRLSQEEMEQQGRLRTAAEWLSAAQQMRNSGTLFLLLTGGEPLIYPDFKEFYLELRKMGFLITINTNGTLIDEQWAVFFGKYKPRRINITLYGADERAYRELCHYPSGFARTMNGFRLLRDQKVEVRASFSITRHNAADLERVMQIVKELDVPVQTDAYMVPAQRERNKPFDQQSRLMPEEAARAFCRTKELELGSQGYVEYAVQRLWEITRVRIDGKRSFCPAGRAAFSVNWQGELHPCVMQTAPAGNVFEMGFAAAWEHVVHETMHIQLCNSCNTCRLRIICRTCAAAALLETGSYDGTPEYLCRYTQETVRMMAAILRREMQRKDETGEQ